MNVYDFDGTIYDGDSSLDLYFFCVRTSPKVLKAFPDQIRAALMYILGKYDKTTYKEQFFSFLQYIDNMDSTLEHFYKKNKCKLKKWYLKQKKANDVIISASPRFIVEKFCIPEGISEIIASEIDIYTGKFSGKNCRDVEKVSRFCERYKNSIVEEFYSDSNVDLPVALLADKSFLVHKSKIQRWNVRNKSPH